MDSHFKSKEQILAELGTSEKEGLSSKQAAELKARYGQNKLKEKKKKSNIKRFADQFKDVMIIILIIAAVISFIIACVEANPREFFEPALILLIIIVNAVMGVIQEGKAEKALDALKDMSAPHAKVIRDGREEIIDAKDLVPGYII